MEIFLKRTELLLGCEKLEKIKKSKIIIFGIGGVGGYCCEALARCGIENIDLVDNDTINESNINRQIIALNSTIGKLKTEVMKSRLLDINPKINSDTFNFFYDEETKNEISIKNYDYVIDAIDSIKSKILLIKECKNLNIPIISSMGTGNKLNPLAFEITDIYKTTTCPLAKVMRQELKKENIKKLKVLYSKELPVVKNVSKKTGIPSCSFVPSTAGLIIASEVIKDLLSN